MIDSISHVQVDGVKYRIAESEEGKGYNARSEPLRPPNAVTVQGLDSQKFQPRPDLLLWSWTDWSEGEGRLTWKFGESGRSKVMNAVRAFEEPGHLLAGYATVTSQYSSSDLAKSLVLTRGLDGLYGLDTNTNDYYVFDANGDATATGSFTGPSNGAEQYGVDGDLTNIFWIEGSTDNVYKWNGTTASTISTTSKFSGSTPKYLVQAGPYVYVYQPGLAKVWEIAKSGASEITIDDWTEAGTTGDLVVMDGRVYAMFVVANDTVVREITPSSAAGTGYGGEVVRINGFTAEAMWAHTGTLYFSGVYEDAGTDRTILYFTPRAQESQYGTLGPVREGTAMGTGHGGAGRMLDHFWVQSGDGSSDFAYLMQVDAVSGGISCLSRVDASDELIGSIVTYQGNVLFSTVKAASTKAVFVARKDKYAVTCDVYSPSHDFDILTDKYLGDVVLEMEPLPADWTVTVYAQFDNDGAWVALITESTLSSTGQTVTASNNGTTYEFSTMQLRILMSHSGSPTPPTTTPVILGVEAHAGVLKKVKVVDMMLDLNDGESGVDSRDGRTKAQSLAATGAKTTVIAFWDGYVSPLAGVYDAMDMTVDAYQIDLDRPGEGVGRITLRGVV